MYNGRPKPTWRWSVETERDKLGMNSWAKTVAKDKKQKETNQG